MLTFREFCILKLEEELGAIGASGTEFSNDHGSNDHHTQTKRRLETELVRSKLRLQHQKEIDYHKKKEEKERKENSFSTRIKRANKAANKLKRIVKGLSGPGGRQKTTVSKSARPVIHKSRSRLS